MNPAAVILVLALIIGFVAWFWRRPEYGPAAIVALLPFERLGLIALGHDGQHLVRLSQIAGAALVLVLIAQILLRKRQLKSLSIWPLVAFLAVAAISAARLHNARIWENWVTLGLAAVMLWAVGQAFGQKSWPLVRRWLFISAGMVGIFGLYQFIGDLAGLPLHWTGLRPEYSRAVLGYPRAQATELEPLYYANYLLLPLFVGMTLLVGHQIRRWETIVLALVGLNFALTMSRGALIGAALAAVAALALLSRHRADDLRRLIKPALAGLVIVVITLTLVGVASSRTRGQFAAGPKLFVELLTTKLFHTGSFFQREGGQNGALAVIKHSPLFGVGPGRFETVLPHYPANRFGYDSIFVNNTPLAIAVETGLAGLFFWLLYVGWLLLRALLELWYRFDYVTLGLTMAAVAILVQSFSFYGVFLSQIWISLGLVAGIIKSERRLHEINQS